jgi:hypothetical protein
MIKNTSWIQTGINSHILEREYDRFVNLLYSETVSAQNKSEILFVLRNTRVEFSTCENSEALKKNRTVAAFLQKAIVFVDMQIVWIERQLLTEQNAVNCPVAQQLQTRNAVKIKWTGNIVDWVELIYSLHEVDSFNSGKIYLRELFGIMGEVFDFEVKEFSNYFMNIKNRTDGHRTKFLDRLKETLLKKMEDTDRKPPRK